MSKLLLTIAAAFLFTSTMAQAEVKTFNFTFSGAASPEIINSAAATGFISFDTDTFVAYGNYLGFDQVIDFGVTVSGTDNNNGVFNKSSFRDIKLVSTGPLDLSRELIGQALPDGTFGYGERNQLNHGFWMTSDNTITAADGYNMVSWDAPIHKLLTLTSFAPQSTAPVPEADTSAMLLMGAGVMGFIARRRKNTKA
jgi:hypothetical protein